MCRWVFFNDEGASRLNDGKSHLLRISKFNISVTNINYKDIAYVQSTNSDNFLIAPFKSRYYDGGLISQQMTKQLCVDEPNDYLFTLKVAAAINENPEILKTLIEITKRMGILRHRLSMFDRIPFCQSICDKIENKSKGTNYNPSYMDLCVRKEGDDYYVYSAHLKIRQANLLLSVDESRRNLYSKVVCYQTNYAIKFNVELLFKCSAIN